ncbi:MAG: long-chain fatty acid--CoA ligase [Alphaproteobacteria bacterium]|nr:long-chain fatty acid--CoA ligase [Alphaproteobacteria bacterium]
MSPAAATGGSPRAPAAGRPQAPRHLVELLQRRVDSTPDALAYLVRTGATWQRVSWRSVADAARRVAAHFVAWGIQPGDRVAIAASTRLEWIVAQVAIWQAGGVVVTVYPSSTADEIGFLLADAGCKAILVEHAALLARVASVRPQLPDLACVVLLDGQEPGTLSWASLVGCEPDGAHALTVAGRGRACSPHDLAALIYTSGTTGRPKGVMLSHDNFVAMCLGTESHTPIEPDDLQYLFLPLSHVYGMAVALVAWHVGVPSALDGDVDRIALGLAETRPTFLPAVPRVFEKIHARVFEQARQAGTRRFAVFTWACDVGRRWSTVERSGQRIPLSLALAHRVADRLVFRRVRDRLGGRLRGFTSGGAPLSPELATFFHAAGLPVLEGYGMTESTAITCANRLEDWRLGTVGPPGDGLQVRIADDGEVLIRGRTVMQGYWNRPDATAETLRDGWLHTGDIGALDPDGFLRITDRKKNLIITAGGKNIAPAPIENALKAASPLIGEAVLHGDRRKYCVALLALDDEALDAFSAREGLTGSHATRCTDPRVRAALQDAVDRVNATLPSFQTVKAFHVLDHVPGVDTGELTPSLKVRRAVLERRFAAELDALYTP